MGLYSQSLQELGRILVLPQEGHELELEGELLKVVSHKKYNMTCWICPMYTSLFAGESLEKYSPTTSGPSLLSLLKKLGYAGLQPTSSAWPVEVSGIGCFEVRAKNTSKRPPLKGR